MKKATKTEFIAFGIGLLLGATLTYLFIQVQQKQNEDHAYGDEYHIHADFLIYLNNTVLDLSEDRYMTTGEQELHKHTHLHDNDGNVQHIHNEGVTFVEFLNSLNIELTTECLTYESETYCTDGDNVLLLFVNNEPFTGDITTYEPMDEDRVLLYFGGYDAEKITTYLNEVGDDACYYSGTCPERGVAPPESCGLTCEL